jgi:hypothetical protein
MAALAIDGFISSGRHFLGLVGRFATAIACLSLLGWLGLLAAWGVGFPVERIVGGAVGLLIVLGAASVLLQAVAAEYLGRIFEQLQHRPLYIVEEVCVRQPIKHDVAASHMEKTQFSISQSSRKC